MKMRQRLVVVASFALIAGVAILNGMGDEALSGANLTGSVRDDTGKPVAGATVRVWTASVKNGYSTYCPSCYADCGKRTITDSEGAFSLNNLSRDLRFQLLIVREGFAPTFVGRVDPLEGKPVKATLPHREPPQDLSQIVRGQVVGPTGEPIREAIIEPEVVWFVGEDGRPTGRGGAVKGLDPLAVSNEAGEFEITYAKTALKMTLMVKARGIAPKRFEDLSTGEKRHPLSLSAGATIRGRLMYQGKPISGAEMGLISKERGSDSYFPEERIGTQADGTFLFANVPISALDQASFSNVLGPVKWYVYAKMNSIVQHGATEAIECTTSRDDEIVDLGDIEIKAGHRLRGQVILTDGKPIAEGMRIGVACNRAWDSQSAMLGSDGRFEFVNLPPDDYSINAAVRGYRLSNKNPNLSWSVEGFIDRDIDDFLIILDPGKEDFAGRTSGRFRGKALQSAPKP